MATVYSYIRFSSKRQERGDSLRRQLERSNDWIERNGHSLADLTLRDMGVSAFRGKHRHKGALSTFLKAIEEGKVKPGSILLVENLDRLSREGVSEAFSVFNDILRNGVKIAVLNPIERVYTKKSINDLVGLIEPLMSFYLAHEESQKKSDRSGHVWKQKRKEAQESGTPFSKRRPSWLDWDEKKQCCKANAKAKKTVKYIFERTVEGAGQRILIGELSDRFPALGPSGHWTHSYIQRLLNDRAVLGELQPYTFNKDGERVPDGPAIPDYYPRIIDDGLFYKAQAVKEKRKKQKGPSKKHINLFTSMVFNARDGHICHIAVSDRRSDGLIHRRLVSSGHLRKEPDSSNVTFDYYAFEEAMLHCISEIKPSDLFSKAKVDRSPLENLEEKLAGVEGRLQELRQAMEESDMALETIQAAASNLEIKKKDLNDEISSMKQKYAASESNPLQQAQSVIELLDRTKGEELQNLRHKLRAIIARLVSKVWTLVFVERSLKTIYIQVHFEGGGYRTIVLRTKRGLLLDFYTHETIRPDQNLKLDIRKKNVWPKIEKSLKSGQLVM